MESIIDKIKYLYSVKKYTITEISSITGISFWKIYNLMKKNDILRRGYSEANYNKYNRYKGQFVIKDNLSPAEERLKVVGIMLYWAEGAKNGYTVDFANSDSRMLQIFLKFLRKICGIDENRLRIYLYAFSNQNIDELKQHWSRILSIPLSQFTKPYIKDAKPLNKDKIGKMLYGLVHIRYNDKKLLEYINSLIEKYIVSLIGEVPEQPNGPDCVKRSVLEKSIM